MRNWSEMLIGRALRWRAPLAILALVITGAALMAVQHLKVDNSLSSWFVDDAQRLQDYLHFLETFGSDDLVVIALAREEGFASIEGTRILREATEALAGIASVAQAFSFVNLTDAASPARRLLRVPSLRALKGDEQRMRFLQSDPLIRGRLISDDGKSALIMLRMDLTPDLNLQRAAFTPAVALALAPFDMRYATAGLSIVYEELNRLSRTEAARLLIVALFLMSALMLLSLRHLLPLAVALGASCLATLWTFGLLAAGGGTINVLSSVVPVVILVIGVSTSVHVFGHLQSLPESTPPEQRLLDGLEFIFKPCALAAATTVVGFASLSIADLPMTRDLGQLLAVGIAAVFVLTFLLIIVLGKQIRFRSSQAAAAASLAAALSTTGTRWPRLVIMGFVLLLLPAVWGMTQIRVDAFPLELFPSGHPIRLDAERIEAQLGPYTTLEFVIQTDDDVLQLQHLQAIDAWADRVIEQGLATWSTSLLDGVKRAHQMMLGGNVREFRLPQSRQQLDTILNYREKLTWGELTSWLKPPHALRLTFAVPAQSAAGLRENLDAILALQPGGSMTVTPAGLMPLWLSQTSVLVNGQIKSFAIALALVMGIIFAALRRVDLALTALAVNLLPVACTLGLMGLAGFRLDLGTVAVASVILGLVVDDTIHFLHRLKSEMQRHPDLLTAVNTTASSSGRAILVSSVVVGLGFGVLGFAQVTSVACFGLLIAAGSCAAVLADLMLAPALLMLIYRRSPPTTGADAGSDGLLTSDA